MSLVEEYRRVRAQTLRLIEGLGPEDCMVQAMPDVSPPKWHLAHTTWFFETFVLAPRVPSHRSPHRRYRELFNSYYDAVGPRPPRPDRGQLSRPTLSEVLEYRAHVDRAMEPLLEDAGDARESIELGLHHEQQHQELLVTDVIYNFSTNPLAPVYRREPLPPCAPSGPLVFETFEGGVVRIGDEGGGFAFDNERPAHRRFVEPFALATRLVQNGEFLEFVRAGGYRDPRPWLADGWAWVRNHGITAPLHWRAREDGSFVEFTAHGEVPLDPHAPVCHVSGYEAAAFAAWVGARLPTEFEWEIAARRFRPDRARWLGEGPIHPRGQASAATRQLFGEVWEWTRSAYEPYPGFVPAAGALGEYNGKFMCGQWVLRGGSVATPRGHVRATYRNFFYPHQRWPFTGIRLARRVA